MKVMAIWDRIETKTRSVFILTDDGQFGEFSPEQDYMGRDGRGKIIWKDTGNFEFFPEEPLVGNKWDFKQAYFYIMHFGGKLIYKDKSIEWDGETYKEDGNGAE